MLNFCMLLFKCGLEEKIRRRIPRKPFSSLFCFALFCPKMIEIKSLIELVGWKKWKFELFFSTERCKKAKLIFFWLFRPLWSSFVIDFVVVHDGFYSVLISSGCDPWKKMKRGSFFLLLLLRQFVKKSEERRKKSFLGMGMGDSECPARWVSSFRLAGQGQPHPHRDPLQHPTPPAAAAATIAIHKNNLRTID